MAEEFDACVIGSGPGGYVAAIRLAQLGKSTAIIEKRETLGGTCLNVGCIPSKALLESSEHYNQAKHSLQDHGINVGNVELDLKKLLKRKDSIVDEVCKGVEFLMKKNKIKRFHAFGRLKSAGEVELLDPESKKVTSTVKAKSIILATGSVPVDIPGFEIDEKSIVTSDHAINLQNVPGKLVILGAGVIGLELGSVWARLGAEVKVVELLPRMMGTADKQVTQYYQRVLEKQGLTFLYNHKAVSVEKKKSGLSVTVEKQDGSTDKIDADVLLVAVGRRPYYDELGLEKAGVELTEKKRIKVDHTFKTSAAGIYAIGDIIDGPMLAHKASEEGVAVAEIIAGQSGHVNYDVIPSVVYTSAEYAWVGAGEEELKEKGIEYTVGKAYYKPNGRAKAMNEGDGMIKILADKKTDRVLGVYIVGAHASDLISEAVTAMEFSASSEDIARIVHAHPTLAEIMKDAAESEGGWAIHA